MHLLTAPRDAHEHQSPFLLQLIRMIEAALVGQDAILHRHQVDHREFQTLGGVKRHQRDAVLLGIPDVGVGHQGRGFQECSQRIVAGDYGPEGFVTLPGGCDEFLNVGEAILTTLVPTLLCEHPAIARFFEDGIEQHGHAARRGPGLLGQFGMELRKLRQGRAGSLGDTRNACRHGGRFQKAAPLVPRPRQQPVE